MEFVAKACRCAVEESLQSTIPFKGGSMFLSRGSNGWGRFIRICQWKLIARNQFMIIPARVGLVGWKNFLEVSSQITGGCKFTPIPNQIVEPPGCSGAHCPEVDFVAYFA